MSIDDYSDIFDSAGKQYDVDPDLLRSIATQESQGNPHAFNQKSEAAGMMQFIPATSKAIGLSNPYDPTQAIYGAAKLISQNKKLGYTDPEDQILAYTGGANNEERWGSHTDDYLTKVSNHYKNITGRDLKSSNQPQGQNIVLGGTGDESINSDPNEAAIQEVSSQRKKTQPSASGDANEDAIAEIYKAKADKQLQEQNAYQNQDENSIQSSLAPSEESLQKVGRGLEQSVLDVGGAGVRGANYLLDKAGHPNNTLHNLQSDIQYTGGLNDKRYGTPDTAYDSVHTGNILTNLKNAVGNIGEFASNPYNVARTGEDVGITAPLMSGGGALLKAGASALPGAGAATEAITGLANGSKALNLLGKGAAIGAKGAGTGAAYNLLTSGTNNIPASELAKTGAEYGAALSYLPPALAGAGKGARSYVSNLGHAIVDPLTEKGINRLADKAIIDTVSKSEPPPPPPNKIDDIINTSKEANDAINKAVGNPLTIKSDKPNTGLNARKEDVTTSYQFVPGELPTLAEVTGSAPIAGIQKTFREMSGPGKQEFANVENHNDEMRIKYLDSIKQTPEDLNNAIQARDVQAKADLEGLWENKRPVDVQPVIDHLNEILSGPEKGRSAVVKSLTPLKELLTEKQSVSESPPIYDAQGNVVNSNSSSKALLQSDPEYLYKSVVKEIDDKLDKKDLHDPDSLRAAQHLMEVKDKLNDAIQQTNPGYVPYRNNYAAASKPIEAMKYLQGLNLTNNGVVSLAKVQNALNNIYKMQNTRGLNPAKSITPEQFGKLKDIRDSLLRQTNTEALKAKGSPTYQNFGGENFLHTLLPGVGKTVGKMLPPVSKSIDWLYSNSNDKFINAMRRKLLFPEEFNSSQPNP